jgi:hypothetical protein
VSVSSRQSSQVSGSQEEGSEHSRSSRDFHMSASSRHSSQVSGSQKEGSEHSRSSRDSYVSESSRQSSQGSGSQKEGSEHSRSRSSHASASSRQLSQASGSEKEGSGHSRSSRGSPVSASSRQSSQASGSQKEGSEHSRSSRGSHASASSRQSSQASGSEKAGSENSRSSRGSNVSASSREPSQSSGRQKEGSEHSRSSRGSRTSESSGHASQGSGSKEEGSEHSRSSRGSHACASSKGSSQALGSQKEGSKHSRESAGSEKSSRGDGKSASSGSQKDISKHSRSSERSSQSSQAASAAGDDDASDKSKSARSASSKSWNASERIAALSDNDEDAKNVNDVDDWSKQPGRDSEISAGSKASISRGERSASKTEKSDEIPTAVPQSPGGAGDFASKTSTKRSGHSASGGEKVLGPVQEERSGAGSDHGIKKSKEVSTGKDQPSKAALSPSSSRPRDPPADPPTHGDNEVMSTISHSTSQTSKQSIQSQVNKISQKLAGRTSPQGSMKSTERVEKSDGLDSVDKASSSAIQKQIVVPLQRAKQSQEGFKGAIDKRGAPLSDELKHKLEMRARKAGEETDAWSFKRENGSEKRHFYMSTDLAEKMRARQMAISEEGNNKHKEVSNDMKEIIEHQQQSGRLPTTEELLAPGEQHRSEKPADEAKTEEYEDDAVGRVNFKETPIVKGEEVDKVDKADGIAETQVTAEVVDGESVTEYEEESVTLSEDDVGAAPLAEAVRMDQTESSSEDVIELVQGDSQNDDDGDFFISCVAYASSRNILDFDLADSEDGDGDIEEETIIEDEDEVLGSGPGNQLADSEEKRHFPIIGDGKRPREHSAPLNVEDEEIPFDEARDMMAKTRISRSVSEVSYTGSSTLKSIYDVNSGDVAGLSELVTSYKERLQVLIQENEELLSKDGFETKDDSAREKPKPESAVQKTRRLLEKLKLAAHSSRKGIPAELVGIQSHDDDEGEKAPTRKPKSIEARKQGVLASVHRVDWAMFRTRKTLEKVKAAADSRRGNIPAEFEYVGLSMSRSQESFQNLRATVTKSVAATKQQ